MSPLNATTNDTNNEDDEDGFLSDTPSVFSDSSTSSHSIHPNHHNHQLDGEVQQLSKAENRKVFYAYRIFVFFVLVISMVGVSLVVYFYISSTENEAFEQQFEEDARKVMDAIGMSLDQTLGAVDSLVVGLVSYARFSNSTWPFVTLPDFAVRSAKARSLSRAVFLNIYPLVEEEDREEWEAYSVENDGWVQEGMDLQKKAHNNYYRNFDSYEVAPKIHGNEEYEDWNFTVGTKKSGPYMPIWQSSPVIPEYPPYNWNLFSSGFTDDINAGIEHHMVSISKAYLLPDPNDPDEMTEMGYEADWFQDYIKPGEVAMEPVSDIYYPIVDNLECIDIYRDGGASYNKTANKFVGYLSLSVYWRDLFRNILPEGSTGIIVVVKNECNPTFAYQIDGPDVTYLGRRDPHNTKFDHLEVSSSLLDLDLFYNRQSSYTGAPIQDKVCPFYLHVFPSDGLHELHTSSNPIIFTLCAVGIFAFTSTVFIIYDCLVERRQAKVMQTAVQSTSIVASLFPSTIRDRMFVASAPMNEDDKTKDNVRKVNRMIIPTKSSSKRRSLTLLMKHKNEKSLHTEMLNRSMTHSTPIADLFPETTVLFADIAGFTAWSSAREASQVFTLLGALYLEFDVLAKKRGVFKVETIGDCYVAVVGLPEPCKNHAVVMAKFARDCRDKADTVFRKLEVTLGPDTSDLQLRFGLHSGQVTAGVLAGDKSRFQLFGDVVNTASRMESLGKKHKIQASETTAEELRAAGKAHWLTPRQDLVQAKGKGMMQTYWIEPSAFHHGKRVDSMTTGATLESTSEHNMLLNQHNFGSKKSDRLIDWNTDVLVRLTKQVILARLNRASSIPTKAHNFSQQFNLPSSVSIGGTVLDEVKEIIEMPSFQKQNVRKNKSDDITLDTTIYDQIRHFVTVIESCYRANPFHNFEHASHVAMSMTKLLSTMSSDGSAPSDRECYEQVYGIDPLTHFACVFCALIHDVDHPGVPNQQLIQEKSPLASQYKQKAIAEQNSVDISWNLFFCEQYKELREALFPTSEEMSRFRQLVVNSVMATDIMDKELRELRNARWDKAFRNTTEVEETPQMILNRKATIVIEHMIQASDVAHTMQHWHVYQKWNKRLFEEMYLAYQQGRSSSGKNPADAWYQGELDFFDFYIIPLAQKMKECQVFGVTADQYLDYAKANRNEWHARGLEIVAQMKVNVQNRTISGVRDQDNECSDENTVDDCYSC